MPGYARVCIAAIQTLAMMLSSGRKVSIVFDFWAEDSIIAYKYTYKYSYK